MFLVAEFFFYLIFIIDIFNGLMILVFKKEKVLLLYRLQLFILRLEVPKEEQEERMQEAMVDYKANIRTYGKWGMMGFLVVGKFVFVVRDLVEIIMTHPPLFWTLSSGK